MLVKVGLWSLCKGRLMFFRGIQPPAEGRQGKGPKTKNLKMVHWQNSELLYKTKKSFAEDGEAFLF